MDIETFINFTQRITLLIRILSFSEIIMFQRPLLGDSNDLNRLTWKANFYTQKYRIFNILASLWQSGSQKMCDPIADNTFGLTAPNLCYLFLLRLCYENRNGLKFAVVKCMACNLIDDMIEKRMFLANFFKRFSKLNVSLCFSTFEQNMWLIWKKVDNS